MNFLLYVSVGLYWRNTEDILRFGALITSHWVVGLWGRAWNGGVELVAVWGNCLVTTIDYTENIPSDY